MRSWIAWLVLLVWLPGTALARPEVGDTLPPVGIDDCGEMQLRNEDVSYRPWQAEGGPLLLHFMAARAGMEELNSPVVRRVLRSRPALLPRTVTLLNTRDAVWGTGGLVKGLIERKKRSIPRARMVLDCTGDLATAWSLPERTSVLLLLDSDGTVRFIQVGATPEERLPALLAAVDSLGLPAVSSAGDSLQ